MKSCTYTYNLDDRTKVYQIKILVGIQMYTQLPCKVKM